MTPEEKQQAAEIQRQLDRHYEECCLKCKHFDKDTGKCSDGFCDGYAAEVLQCSTFEKKQ